MTNLFQSLLLVIAGATQKELARQIKFLKVENQILRSKLPKRVTITPKERHRLVKFDRKLGGKVLRQLTTIVAPDTVLNWIRDEKKGKRIAPLPVYVFAKLELENDTLTLREVDDQQCRKIVEQEKVPYFVHMGARNPDVEHTVMLATTESLQEFIGRMHADVFTGNVRVLRRQRRDGGQK